MPDMREDFEAWVTAAMGGYVDLRKSNDPNFAYDDADVDFAYQAWQASRAALRVELPEVGSAPDGANYDLGFGDPKFANDYREHQVSAAMRQLCREAIQQAGIEVAK
ncbi:hypothetical protein KUT57_22620 [Pseudomonas aeruginosa]|nr:hypothetical protein [Pseudomonas aeruginosa]MBV5799348.1 hypothetical protein [Pseudomonas aeruginosa]